MLRRSCISTSPTRSWSSLPSCSSWYPCMYWLVPLPHFALTHWKSAGGVQWIIQTVCFRIIYLRVTWRGRITHIQTFTRIVYSFVVIYKANATAIIDSYSWVYYLTNTAFSTIQNTVTLLNVEIGIGNFRPPISLTLVSVTSQQLNKVDSMAWSGWKPETPVF